MTASILYPIGTPGTPWGEAERRQWRDRQRVQRSYADDVLAAIDGLRDDWQVLDYGRLPVDAARYPLRALRSRDEDPARPLVLVTGGVHGYETSGVHGALRFLQTRAAAYRGRVDLIVVPCVSPWGYETIQRWNAEAVDPNRSFRDDGRAPEALALMALLAPWRQRVDVHIDLHETTDSDESEFRPALAARDGKPFEPGEIPDGFYLVDDSERPSPAFQQAILEAVARVTPIAPADARGQLIGSDVVAPGVIRYPMAALGLCAGHTAARFRTTTEVYPDSPRASAEQCIAAQVAAITAAIDHALGAPA